MAAQKDSKNNVEELINKWCKKLSIYLPTYWTQKAFNAEVETRLQVIKKIVIHTACCMCRISIIILPIVLK